MAVETAADRSAFVGDFGESFKLGQAHAFTGTITGIFDLEYVEIGDAIQGKHPVLTCVTADITAVEVDGYVTRVSNGKEYKVRVIEADGTGMTQLILNETN